MATVILTHEVKDFSTWKTGFDAGEAMRTQGGVTVSGVYTAADNGNLVTVITEFPSAEAVQGFLNSAELKAEMEKAGVIGAPSISVLNKV